MRDSRPGPTNVDASVARCLLLYTKPARPGRVKTRLIGELSAAQTAELHAAFLADLGRRLEGGRFHLRVAWALEAGEALPRRPPAGGADQVRQTGGDLGERLFGGLSAAAESFESVAAIGSDCPELERATIETAFLRLENGADAVFGPTGDGGYYLIGLKRSAVRRELFAGISWSTEAVLEESLARCRRLGLDVALLPPGHDVDVVADLRRLAARLTAGGAECPRTRALLERWGWLAPRPAGRVDR